MSPNSLTSTAVRASAGCRSRGFSSVVLPAPRNPVTTVIGVVSAMRVTIQRVRVDQRRGNLNQAAVTRGAEKAVAATGVAGHSVLLNQQQQRVAVAVDPQFLQVLDLAGRLP